MTTIELKPLGAAERVFWTTAQLLGLVITVVFIIGFFARPDTALNTLWNAAIPLRRRSANGRQVTEPAS